MVSKKGRESIFFILIFCIFFLGIKAIGFWTKHTDMNPMIIEAISSLVFTMLIVVMFYTADLEKEGFWDVSDLAKCKGGAYFWQGDSQTSKMCKSLAETKEGRIALSSYNCPTGYVGQPGLPFYYAPQSDDNWQNGQCGDKPSCPGVDQGLCSLEKQVA